MASRRSAPPLDRQAFLDTSRFPSLDGLRAVAVLLVATVHPAYPHFWPAFHGTSGVSLFFVLSGFLITTLCLREEADERGFDLGGFYIRRVFRIYPVFFLVLLLYVVLIVVLNLEPARREVFLEHLPWMVLMVPEHATYFNESGVAVPFDGSWSLGIEEKFYLLWPVLAFVLLKGRFRPRVALVAFVTVACTIASMLEGPWYAATAPYGLIAAGCWLALLMHHPRWYERVRVLARPRVLAVIVVLVVAIQLGTNAIAPGGSLYVVYGVVLAALLGGIVLYSGRAVGFLASSPFVFLGRISYAFYLLHNFGLNAMERLIPPSSLAASIASTVLGLAAVAVVCWVLHVCFERPLIRVGHRLAKRRKAARTVPGARPPDVDTAVGGNDEPRS